MKTQTDFWGAIAHFLRAFLWLRRVSSWTLTWSTNLGVYVRNFTFRNKAIHELTHFMRRVSSFRNQLLLWNRMEMWSKWTQNSINRIKLSVCQTFQVYLLLNEESELNFFTSFETKVHRFFVHVMFELLRDTLIDKLKLETFTEENLYKLNLIILTEDWLDEIEKLRCPDENTESVFQEIIDVQICQCLMSPRYQVANICQP